MRTALDEAVTGLAMATVGACQRALDMVLEYVRGREQFGVPIGSFQAVKHKAVDMYVAIERARALGYFAALTIAEDDDRRSLAASMAKAAAGDAQRSCSSTASSCSAASGSPGRTTCTSTSGGPRPASCCSAAAPSTGRRVGRPPARPAGDDRRRPERCS